ncbi:MAG: hypothetical protein R2771_15045 [Saprospiraceae bacterium]
MKYLKFDTPAINMSNAYKSNFGLENLGLVHIDTIYWNLPVPALVEEAVFRGEGKLVNGGAFEVNTGKWTARLPMISILLWRRALKKILIGDRITGR